MKQANEPPRFFDLALARAVLQRLGLVALAQFATARAYYGVPTMYLKLQLGVLEDGNARLVPMHEGHLAAFDLVMLAAALGNRKRANGSTALDLAVPVMAAVVGGWLIADPPVGRAFLSALALAPLVAFGAFPLPPARTSSAEGDS